MSGINDLWKAYLNSLGFSGGVDDMLRAALKQELNTSENKSPNSLWYEYLRGEGYSGGLNDMMYQWLGDKGYTGSLNDRWMQALINDDVFGPGTPTCTVTLTSEDAAGFGMTPWPVISGATASIPSMAAAAEYLVATTPIFASPTVDWSGVRAIQARITAMSASPGQGLRFQCGRVSDFVHCHAHWNGTQWVIEVYSDFNTLAGTVQTGVADSAARVTWLVDGTSGDLSVVVGSVLVTKDTTPTSGSVSLLGGLFAGGTAQCFNSCFTRDNAGGKSVSIEYYPSGADMTPIPVDSVLDWCGIDPVPYDPPEPSYDPAALFESGTYNGFLYDPRVPGNLAQLSDGTGAVGSGDPVGYLTDLSGSGNHARQSVSGSRGTFPGIALDGADDHYRIISSQAGGHDFADWGAGFTAFSGFFKVRAENASATTSGYTQNSAKVGCTVANLRQQGTTPTPQKNTFTFGINANKIALGVASNIGFVNDAVRYANDSNIPNGEEHTIGFVVTVGNPAQAGGAPVNFKIYQDGVMVDSSSTPFTSGILALDNRTANLYIGTRISVNGASLDRLEGELGPCLLINKELTDSDFANLHAWAMS